MNKMFKLNIIVFMTLLLGVLASVFMPTKVYAQVCSPDGAYGQTCVFDREFEIDKDVRIAGDNTWSNIVTDVALTDVVEFRIQVRNIGDVEVDNMRMEDFLPTELERISGSGLTEYWNDFDVGETETFIIQARIKASEFDRDTDFEKCVVNVAEAYFDGDLIGSDTATVCYGNEEITDLPETGPLATEAMTIMGLASTGLGLIFKRKK